MARYSVGSRTVTNLPQAARGPGVFAGSTSGGFWLREIKVTNTTVTAVAVGILYCTATGTQVGGLTEVQTDDPSNAAPSETTFTSQSTDSTGNVIDQVSLGAAIGSGFIFRWDKGEVWCPEGTGNGVVISCPTGTAQHLDFTIKWEK